MGFPGFSSGAVKKSYTESRSTPTSSFAELSHDELEMHMERVGTGHLS